MSFNEFSSAISSLSISSFLLTSISALDSAVNVIDNLDREIIRHLQADLPLTTTPFAAVASRVGIGEEELLERIRGLKERGVLRRFGATVSHLKAGIKANVMVAWYVPEDQVDEVGPLMASLREVSHCYERKTNRHWKYNLFTMVHGKSRKQCREVVGRIAEMTGIEDYAYLFTRKEFKKTSPEYF
jgi:DNA-binding Lrp family transcriptional regulator